MNRTEYYTKLVDKASNTDAIRIIERTMLLDFRLNGWDREHLYGITIAKTKAFTHKANMSQTMPKISSYGCAVGCDAKLYYVSEMVAKRQFEMGYSLYIGEYGTATADVSDYAIDIDYGYSGMTWNEIINSICRDCSVSKNQLVYWVRV